MLAGGGPAGSAPRDETAHSFAAARLLGSSTAWPPPVPLTAWAAATAPAGPPTDPLAAGPERAWTAAAQDRTAREVLQASLPRVAAQPRARRSVLLAGHDLKFARELADQLAQRTDLAVTVDDWPELGRGTAHTRTRVRRADAIFAEWARTSAVWLSRHKRPGQFLAVRLHRFELDAPYPHQIAIDNVDAVVYIAPLFGRRIRDELGWPNRKLVYIPNYIDLDSLSRPKLPDARFAIGLVGVEWSRKRFDLALDLVSALRRQEPRFTLFVRSVMPWHNKFAWANPKERAYATACFNRIQQDPYLRGGVVFEPAGRDMARWLRGIGYILSTSDEEGSHTAVTEGMASGAVPLVRPWPGADELYGQEWLCPSLADAATTLLDTDEHTWAQRAERARAEARRTHNPEAVVEAWADLLHGEIDNARRHFAEFSRLTG
jgi:glycosyltransferase involved in cell wall biosynthesis